jgi:GntP family gluconate:H+ symporter
MSALVALAVGIAVVMGSIVLLRQHAFIALLAAGFAVGLLTQSESIFRSQLRSDAIKVGTVQADGFELEGMSEDLKLGTFEVYRENAQRRWTVEGQVSITAIDGKKAQIQTNGKTLHRDDVLVTPAAVAEARKVAGQSSVVRLVNGFGETCRKIGILIAMASVIGVCLLESGGAARIVLAITGGLGEKRSPIAFAFSGFTLGVPVYFDTVFFLLIPLAKALYRQTRQHYMLYVLAVVVGATMAHSLVPPTPGPLFVAEELGVNLGLTMLCGLVIGSICAVVGYGYAIWLDWRLPGTCPTDEEVEKRSESTPPIVKLPALWLALLPILMPVVLLGTVGVLDFLQWRAPYAWVNQTIDFVGDKNVALSISALIALVMLYRSKQDAVAAQQSIQKALSNAGIVILITAAGGAFGQMIRQTDIASQLAQWIPSSGSAFALLAIAFLTTALVRVAQGSATVAMITAIGIIGPVAATMDLPFHPVYLVMAIGCGSKPLPWMNDSGFWVVGKMSGLTPGETFRGFSLMLTLMGLTGLLVTLAAAWLVPLAPQ